MHCPTSSADSLNTSYRVLLPGSFERSRLVALHCESTSMTRTRCSRRVSACAKLTAAVVFPTPPLLLTSEMILPAIPPPLRALYLVDTCTLAPKLHGVKKKGMQIR